MQWQAEWREQIVFNILLKPSAAFTKKWEKQSERNNIIVYETSEFVEIEMHQIVYGKTI